MRTLQDLQEKQALPLSLKIRLTKARIREWINEFDESGVYVSFSGGKDSTVLLDLVRQDYPNVPAVFVDTGLEYPEIREFVKTFDNVTWLKPKMGFRKVIETYGYPFISKEVSLKVYYVRNKKSGTSKYMRFFDGSSRDSQFNLERYKYFLNCPFEISHYCCNMMKKNPFHKYEKETGRLGITAQMAQESKVRTRKWLQHGCNAFDAKKKISNPMSFWTEQDVLQYIKENNLPICSVYGDVVVAEEVDGQTTLTDFGFDTQETPFLKTTGCTRTGCMFCGYGCHLEKEGEGRFERMKITHPKQYEWIMKPWDEGGLGYKDVIDWINEHGNLNIRY